MQVLRAGWYHCKTSAAQNISLSAAMLIPFGSGALISKDRIRSQFFSPHSMSPTCSHTAAASAGS